MLLLLAIAGLPSLLSAQERTRFLFDHFEVEHGLSQGSINALVQDARGFLWIATDDGLNRFDGYQFLSFRPDPADEHSLLGNVITALAVDAEGCIWIGSSGIGVQRYDPRTRQFSLHPTSVDHQPANLASVSITTMRVDRQNRLWIGTREKGLYMYDKHTDSLEYIPLDPANPEIPVLDMAVTRSGTFVISSGTAGVFVVDPQRRSVRKFPLSETRVQSQFPADIVTAYVEGDRFLWLGLTGGVLLRHDVRTGNWREFVLSEYRHRQVPPIIRALTMDTAGRMWVATSSSGLYVLDPESGERTHLTADVGISVSLPSDGLRCLHTDRLGNVWVGTNGSGLGMYSPVAKEFCLLSAQGTQGPGLTVTSVRAIWQDSDSVLWLGGYGGFNRFDRKNGTVRTYPGLPGSGRGPYRGISSRNVYAIHPRSDRSERFLILGTEGDGLFEFDKHREVFRRISIDAPDGSRDETHPLAVYTMFQTRNGDLWMGSSAGLLHWAFSQGAVRPVLLDSDLGFTQQGGIHAIYEDANGYLWIGTSRSGLALYDRLNGTVNFFTHRPGDSTSLATNSITCIFEDSHGDFWVGTTLGLHLMNLVNATFRIFTTRDGLPNDVIYGILEDRAGYLWLSTNRGLTRFHRQRGVDAIYDAQDGLQGNEFNTGAYFASPAGELFFGGVRGLTCFFPERIAHNTTVPPVVVTDVRVGNRSVQLRNMGAGPDTVTLDYRDGTITFTFAALSFYRPENNRYRYRIEGRGDEWIDLGNERYLSFAGLNPGVYNLHVQGSNNDGIWNETGATVTLIVEPPFWAEWWFRILLLLLIGGLVVLGYRRRMTRIRGQERQLTTEVEHRTSELRHANAALLAEIEERKKAEADAYRANATKSEFLAHISHEIRTPMNAILGFTELLQDKIHEEELRQYLNSIAVSGNTLLTLINDVLDLSKIEAGRLELEYRPTSIRGIVDEIRQLFAYQMQRKNLTFEARINDSVHTLLYLDETRIRQILLNLVGNAVKFTEKGHISVEVKSMHEAGDRCTLTIIINDTGIGIAPSQQERVFEPFRQGRTQGRNTDYQGSGLGLAITQRLVQMMEGNITLSSRLGIGSSFRVQIPAVTIVADTMEMEFLMANEDSAPAETYATHIDRPSGDGVPALESRDDETSPEELADLYHTLNREALPRWKRLRRTNVIHEIEQFAGDMNAVAERTAFSPLMEWSERLLRDVRSFDMERLPLTLDAFPEILATLSKGNTNASPSQQEDDERQTSPDPDRR